MRVLPTISSAALVAVLLSTHAAGEQAPLSDPIPEKIQPSGLVLAAEEFVRVPRTSDSSEDGQTNAAYARIQ
ncbi:MAG: hypothetical protein OSB03_14570, partial [Vicinamibacterales bacterium]|nr:hypothetical protein [Vicinamibacterales bacterium]